MYFTLLVVVILTAIALVAVALGIARAVSPRSYNPQKGEAYECGIPTRGRSWMQTHGTHFTGRAAAELTRHVNCIR